jgi:hypothetical protein
MSKLPNSSRIIKNAKVLQPKRKSQSWTLEGIKVLNKKLPMSINVDHVADEWRLYQMKTIPDEWYQYTDLTGTCSPKTNRLLLEPGLTALQCNWKC